MDSNSLREKLIRRISSLSADLLPAAEAALLGLSAQSGATSAIATAGRVEWPHAPTHQLSANGTYMVTTGTYRKAHHFAGPARLALLESALLSLAAKYGFSLEAWAVFSNHYHFVGHTLATPSLLREFLSELHAGTAREINRLDRQPGRQVWHNFWDKRLTFEKSYLARLHYVHQNPVKHGLVPVANQYRWCSAAWFEQTARPAQVKTIYSFRIDALKITDDFAPLAVD